MHAPKALTKKIGPLPAWAWVLVIAGGIFAARKLKGSGGNDTAAGDSGEPAQDLQSADYGGYGPVGPGPVGSSGVDNPTVDGGFTPSPMQDYTPELMGMLFETLNNAIGNVAARPTNPFEDISASNEPRSTSDNKFPDITVKAKPKVKEAKPKHKPKKRPAAKPHPVHDKPRPAPHSPKHSPAIGGHGADAVRHKPQTVTHGQGSKQKTHSPAIGGGGGRHFKL